VEVLVRDSVIALTHFLTAKINNINKIFSE